jgi:CheY-like chemotaxis protein
MSHKILVVDDEADIRIYLSTILKKADYEVVTASDGDEALEVAIREKPDLVCLDLHMPNQTGTGFYKKLVRHKELGGTPVIVISGLAGREVAVSKPVAVFDKPIDPEDLLQAVEDALG